MHPILAVILIKAAEIDEVKEPDKVKRYRFDGDEKSEYFTTLFLITYLINISSTYLVKSIFIMKIFCTFAPPKNEDVKNK